MIHPPGQHHLTTEGLGGRPEGHEGLVVSQAVGISGAALLGGTPAGGGRHSI